MVHEKELTNTSCRMCGKLCKDERTLMKHAWDHSKEKNHSCPKCGKSFFNKARLKRHMQSHRNKSVACNVCGENFPDGRSLMNHRHSHTNLSGRQFPCRECGKTFGSRSSQQIHMRIHTGTHYCHFLSILFCFSSNDFIALFERQVSDHTGVDSVGRHLQTVVLYENMSASTLVTKV